MAKSKASNKKTSTSAPVVESSLKTADDSGLLYGRDFYIWMAAGFLLIVIGFFLMAGGNQAPNEWNPEEIYSWRRTIIAPIFIVAGLVVEVYAIFKK